jgi:ribosomal protein S20
METLSNLAQHNLASELKHLGKTEEEQIKNNQEALKLIRSWQEEITTEKDLENAQKSWEIVKKIIDENRSRKLFS